MVLAFVGQLGKTIRFDEPVRVVDHTHYGITPYIRKEGNVSFVREALHSSGLLPTNALRVLASYSQRGLRVSGNQDEKTFLV